MPSTLLEVSCKGRCLLACAGASPDIEILDVWTMRRVVRLFGHGDWCVDICTRHLDNVPGIESQRDTEPTIYSVDRGGTLCCWLPDKSCGKGVVGWIPSVQVHCVPVAFPASLALDAQSQYIMVVGIGECVCYSLGKDHRLAGRHTHGTVIGFGSHSSPHVVREVHQEDSALEPPEKTRRRRHASVAASRPPLRRWNSAPPDADEASLEKSRPSTAAHNNSLSQAHYDGINVAKSVQVHGRSLNDLQRWTKVEAIFMPRDSKALVWEKDAGLYLIDLHTASAQLLDSTLASCFAGDGEGWFCIGTDQGQVHVWSPHQLSAPYREPVHGMSAHAALRERHKSEARDRDAPDTHSSAHHHHRRHHHTDHQNRQHECKHEHEHEHCESNEHAHRDLSKERGDAEHRPSAQHERQRHGHEHVEDAKASSQLPAQSIQRKPPRDFTAVSQVWCFAGEGRLGLGWEGTGCDAASRSGEYEASCTLLNVHGASPWRDPLSGEEVRRHAVPEGHLRVMWIVGRRNGCIDGYQLPEGKVRLKMRGSCSVSALLWPPNSNTIISGFADGSVCVWSAEDSRLLHRYRSHAAAVTSLCLLDAAGCGFLRSHSVFCSCAADRAVILATYDAFDSTGYRVLSTLHGHSSVVSSLRWAPRHGHLYACCTDGSLHVWQLQQHEPSVLVRVVPQESAHLVLQALERTTPHLGTQHLADPSAVRAGDDADSDGLSAASHRVLADEDESEPLEFIPPVQEARQRAQGSCAACPSVLLLHADVISLAASKTRQTVSSPARPMRPSSPDGTGNGSGNDSPMMPHAAVQRKGRSSGVGTFDHQQEQELQEQTHSGRPVEHGNGSESQRTCDMVLLSFAALMSQLVCPPSTPDHVRIGTAAALADIGVPEFLAPQYTSTFDPSGVFCSPPLCATIALRGAGDAVTCLVPARSRDAAVLTVSQAFTSTVTISATVLLDTYRSFWPGASRQAEASSEVLHWIIKGLAGQLPNYRDSNVISLAQYWLLAPDSARQAAHMLLTATLGRTDAAKRRDIVAEWTPKLDGAAAAAAASPSTTTTSSKAVKGDGTTGAYGGGGAGQDQSQSAAHGTDGFTGKEGPALVVLAVIGSHFKEALDRKTCARVADALVRAVSSSNPLHAKVASHLLSRGAQVWGPHIKDGEGLLRTLYTRYWRYNDFNTTMADSEWALRCLAPMLPAQFVEVVGEEASRHSQLVCHVRSERSVTAIKVLVALFKKNPVEMLPALPRAVEVVLRTLDPGHPLVRQALMQHSTAALKEIVRKFPMAAFHQDTQRFAVGTTDALVVIYDLRTATKWRVLEGHECAIR